MNTRLGINVHNLGLTACVVFTGLLVVLEEAVEPCACAMQFPSHVSMYKVRYEEQHAPKIKILDEDFTVRAHAVVTSLGKYGSLKALLILKGAGAGGTGWK